MVYPALLPLMAHTSAASRLNLRPPADLNGLVRFARKTKIWFLRVCHHISTGLYQPQVTDEDASRSQCPAGLRRGSAATRLLGLRVRIPPRGGRGSELCVVR